MPEEADLAKDEKCEFLPFCLPKQVIVRNGKIAALELYKTDYDDKDNVVIDEGTRGCYGNTIDQFVRLKCDFVISAFGSQVGEDSLLKSLNPLTLKKDGFADVDLETGQAKVTVIVKIFHNGQTAPWLFCGGDLIGNGTTVEAVNDGKTASWFLHKYIQSQHGEFSVSFQ